MHQSKSSHGRRLATPYAFVDTEAFRAAGLDWSSRTWSSLVDLAKQGTLRPITTSITVREVEARLSNALAEAEAAAQKHAAIFNQLGQVSALGDGDRSSRQAELNGRFRKFLKKAKFTEIPVVASIEQVLEDYFAGAAPFGVGKKKHEFPDAFVMSSLIAWINSHRSKIYVVGKDPDLVAFCTARQDLVHLDSVAELLSLALASSELLARLESHVRSDSDLLRNLKKRLNSYRARRSDIDVDDIEFDNLAIDSVLLVDEDGDEFVLEVGVTAEVEVEVSETGHEYVMTHQGEPDLQLRTRHARPRSSAEVYLEVLVTAEADDNATMFETTDWDISSGEVEIRLPRHFSRRTLSLEPRR
jgi:PIN domain